MEPSIQLNWNKVMKSLSKESSFGDLFHQKEGDNHYETDSTIFIDRGSPFNQRVLEFTHISSVMDCQRAALSKHARSLVGNPTLDISKQSKIPYLLGRFSHKTSKRVNICDFSFEPSVPSAKKPSFLELQEKLLRGNYSKLPAALFELFDRSILAREFRVFKYLPVEVQRKIFKLSEPGPRVVELRYSNKIAHAASPTPVPAVMRICSESRLEARKRYVLLFKEHWTIPRVWIDPEVDTLYLGHEGEYGYGNAGRPYGYSGNHLYINGLASYFQNMLSSLESSVWSDLKRLGINETTYSNHHARHLFYLDRSSSHPKTSDLGILTRFRRLQQIAIV
jgi:hypothetical protein